MAGWTTVTESTKPAAPTGWTPVQETMPSEFGEGTTATNKPEKYAAKALSAAGLPTSISNVPDWFMHLVGAAKDSKPFWNAFQKAVEEPTEENIVGAVPLIGPASVSMSKDVRSGDYGGAAATLAGTVGAVKGPGQIKPGLTALKGQLSEMVPSKISAIPEKLYQSALKPPPGSFTTPEVQSMVNTGLKYEIPVSANGVDKLQNLVRDLNEKVQAKIDAGAKAGQSVNKYSVTGRLSDAATKFATQVNPEADLNAVGNAGNEFLRNQPNEILVGQAQKLKSGTYQQLGNKAYGELSSATIEAQKALARGLKEELEIQFPEIKGLNAQQSKLYDLQPALERAVRRIDNHDIISLGSKVTASAGAAIGGAPGAVAGGILEKTLGMPMVKSRLAIALHQAGVPMPVALARVTAYANALANANPQSAANDFDLYRSVPRPGGGT